jgi:hypothetical protein
MRRKVAIFLSTRRQGYVSKRGGRGNGPDTLLKHFVTIDNLFKEPQ